MGKKADWKLFLREDQRLGLCGETGWFLNPFLNHNALSVRSAQSIKVFEGEENNFDTQNEMGTQGVRGKFNEQLWVNFLNWIWFSFYKKTLKIKNSQRCQKKNAIAVMLSKCDCHTAH